MADGGFKVPVASIGRRKRLEKRGEEVEEYQRDETIDDESSLSTCRSNDEQGASEVPPVDERAKVEGGDDSNATQPASHDLPTEAAGPLNDRKRTDDVIGSGRTVTSEECSSVVREPVQPLPYTVPHWSGELAGQPFSLSVIKNGSIIEEVDISKKPYVVFGRLGVCDVCLEHPSISRYHAVLQYRPPVSKGVESTVTEGDNEQEPSGHTLFSSNPREPGHYIFDLDSTHGTYLNKHRINSRCYYRVRVGQMIKFGGSSRLFLLEVRLHEAVTVHVYVRAGTLTSNQLSV